QIAVLEDGILVEHYVTRASETTYVGNIYLGRVQNVLPSMEAAFVDIGKGRNGVLYAGEVNWDAAGLEGRNRTIQDAMSAGDPVLVQVTKDPIGHKGARLTSQISLPGRFLVYVPSGGMTGISRKLPDTERTRLKAILKKIIPDDAGVIIRTAAEGASEEELTQDVDRLKSLWESIQVTVGKPKNAPIQVHAEPDLAIRVVRDVFNEDFQQLIVSGDPGREDDAWETVSQYVGNVAPELSPRLSKYVGTGDLFHDLRVDEQLAKALDRKVWLPSGGSLVIDRTEAMTVIDVNTGKFTGAGGNLEQTVTRNNIEAAEEIVRQLRLRDIGGMVVVDFIDMVLESNRDLVLSRLTECLGRDRTKHQVAEVTSLGLVQMTRKRVGEGLLEAFSEPCEHCHGRGVIVHTEPVSQPGDTFGSSENGSGQGGSGQYDSDGGADGVRSGKRRNRRGRGGSDDAAPESIPVLPPEGQRKAAASVMALIAGAVALADAEDVLDALDDMDAGARTASIDGDPIDVDGDPIDTDPIDTDPIHTDPIDTDPIDTVDAAADEFVEAAPAAPARVEMPAAPEALPELQVQAVFDVAPAATIEIEPEPVYEGDPTIPPVSRPRRRRGASRPAGPPVHA
ncbi:MAG: ribonuclease, Rne/Rng family, partial [Jatrophihabitantaceae bacterium]|nr:ribonuclease, Rne/Rng family [Jatrophihabitantaceae bacterium]